MDGKVWFNATSNIQRQQRKHKSCGGKSHTNKRLCVGSVNPGKSNGILNSFMNFHDATLDTSNYKQTNINNYLKEKCKDKVADARAPKGKTREETQQFQKDHCENMCSEEMSMPVTICKNSIVIPNNHEPFDKESNMNNLLSPIITREFFECRSKDEFNDIPYNSSCSEFFESQPIIKIKPSEKSSKTNQQTEVDLDTQQEQYAGNGKFEVPESTLLMRLHEESCNTLLDPESEIHVSRKVTGQNLYIEKFHEYSYHTNLDPYTELPPGINDESSKNNLKQNILKDIHAESLQTNLDPYTEYVTSDTVNQILQHSQDHNFNTNLDPNTQSSNEINLRDMKQKVLKDIHNQSLYTNLDPYTELKSYKPNEKEPRQDVLVDLNDQSLYTNLDPFTEEESPSVCVQAVDSFRKQKKRNCLASNTKVSSGTTIEPPGKKPFQIYKDENDVCHKGLESNNKIFNNKPPSTILRDKIIFNDSSSDSPEVVSDLKRICRRNEIEDKKNFDKENVGYDSFWDG